MSLSAQEEIKIAKIYFLAVCDFVYDKIVEGRTLEADELSEFLEKRLRDGLDLLLVQTIEVEIRSVSISHFMENPVKQIDIRHFVSKNNPIDRIVHNHLHLCRVMKRVLSLIHRVKRRRDIGPCGCQIRKSFARVISTLPNDVFQRLITTHSEP
jgi:hypothetical protein